MIIYDLHLDHNVSHVAEPPMTLGCISFGAILQQLQKGKSCTNPARHVCVRFTIVHFNVTGLKRRWSEKAF